MELYFELGCKVHEDKFIFRYAGNPSYWQGIYPCAFSVIKIKAYFRLFYLQQFQLKLKLDILIGIAVE